MRLLFQAKKFYTVLSIQTGKNNAKDADLRIGEKRSETATAKLF